MKFVSSAIYQRVLSTLISEGIDKDLLKSVPSNNVRQLQEYRSLDDLFLLYELAEQHLKKGVSMRIGQSLQPDDYGTLGLAWKTAWSAKDMLSRLMRYLILITNRGDFELTERGAKTYFSLNRSVYRNGQAISNEVTFVMIVNMIRMLTNSNIRPEAVTFKHSALSILAPYENFFTCPVHFNHTHNAICFRTKDLEIPSVKADKSIHQFILERMEEEKKGIEKQSSLLLIDIEKLIKDALPSGIPNINEIGSHLGMSRRTLGRRLADFDLSFRDIIRQTQEAIAKDLLHNQSLSIGEIAFQSGFSDQTAFNRAFRRWTGTTPSEYRKRF